MSAKNRDEARSDHVQMHSHGERSIRNVENYAVGKEGAVVNILLNDEESEYIYYAQEPVLSKEETVLLKDLLSEIEHMVPLLTDSNSIETYADLEVAVLEYIRSRHPSGSETFNRILLYEIHKKNTGFGKLHVLVMDNEVEDISCNGPGLPVYVYHKKYGSLKTNIAYEDEAELSSALVKMAQLCGKEVSVSNPILDGITSTGHRVQGMYGKEVTPKGSAFTVRLFREKPFTPVDLVRSGAASSEMVAYFWYMVEYLASALIIGPPAVGKTSTLNSLLMLAPPNTKVFSIEETREIHIMHPNWVAASTREAAPSTPGFGVAEGRIDLFELVKMAMRQRPTYIVVGEVRGREAYTLFQAMSTGHTTYSTMHAESMGTMLNRLESEPLNVPRILLSYLGTVIINHFIRREQKTLRRITEVNEVVGVDRATRDVVYNRVFTYDSLEDRHTFSGYSLLMKKIAGQRNIDEKALMEEFKIRKRVIDYMVKTSAESYSDISSVVNAYYNNRKWLEERIKEVTDV